MVGRQLPYKWLAGITPCPKGWLIIAARLAGVTVVVEDAMVVHSLLDVVDFRPKFDAAAINIPMGFNDYPTRDYGNYGRCEYETRQMVGWPRLVAVRPIPSRAALKATTKAQAREIEPWLTNDDFRKFRWLREAESVFQPFHQRNFFSAHPDLSYTLLNEDRPLRTSPFHTDGVLERMNLIRNKLPGVEEIITRPAPAGAGQAHVVQAVGLLWTARRASGRAINRLPIDPTWDTNGLRVELVR
jgi:predicted RNase H-like nuclease